MRTSNIGHRFPKNAARHVALFTVALMSACANDEPGLFAPGSGGSDAQAGNDAQDTAGESANNTGGSSGTAGQQTAGSTTAGQSTTTGGSDATNAGGTGNAENGAAGSEPVAEGGTPSMGGDSGQGGVRIAEACVFHSNDAAAAPEGGAGGADGLGPNVTLQVSAFIGGYLADGSGRALYTYGGDLPGDCNTPPQSTCTADCLVSWPIFDAGERLVGPGLTDAGFGTIQRADGSHQTTYMGWPLYYYKSDLTLGQMTGQGKGKTWHVAKSNPPNVTIMKAGTAKYLADAAGHTIYVSADDQSGTGDADPVSNCSGECLATFEPFNVKNLSVVTTLDTRDFSVFVRRGSGGLQLAYKGMPLYRAATDLKSGEMNGTVVTGFTAAAP